MVKCEPAGMQACSLRLVGLGFRVRDKVRASVRIGLVLGFAMVLEWEHFTFYHTSSPQKPTSPQAACYPSLILVTDQRSDHNNGKNASARWHTYLW